MLSENEIIRDMITRLKKYTENYLANYKKEIGIGANIGKQLGLIENLITNMNDDLNCNVNLTATTTYDVYMRTLSRILEKSKENYYQIGFCGCFHKNYLYPDVKTLIKKVETELIPAFKKIKDETFNDPHKIDINLQKESTLNDLPIGYARIVCENEAQPKESTSNDNNNEQNSVEMPSKDNSKDGKSEEEETSLSLR